MQTHNKTAELFERNFGNTGENEIMNEEEFLIEMKNFFENIEQLRLDLEEQIKETELARNDLLHEIELSNLNAFELTKVAGRLKKTRKERRDIKDKLEFIATVKGFSDKYTNKLITGDLINLLKNIKQLKKNRETRIYKTRVLEDLKISKMKENIKKEEEKQNDNSKSK